MAAQQGDPVFSVQFRAAASNTPGGESLAVQVCGARVVIPVAANLCEKCFSFPADRFEHFNRLGPLRRTHSRYAQLDDARLLARDLGQRVTQQVGVVQAK